MNSLADFLLFVDGCEGSSEELPFRNKITYNIGSGIAYVTSKSATVAATVLPTDSGSPSTTEW